MVIFEERYIRKKWESIKDSYTQIKNKFAETININLYKSYSPTSGYKSIILSSYRMFKRVTVTFIGTKNVTK